MVNDLSAEGIFKQAIDGEVAALSVMLGRGKCYVIGPASIAVRAIGTKRSDLDVMIVMFDNHDAKVCTDFVAFGEKLEHLLGRSRGGDVVVLRLALE